MTGKLGLNWTFFISSVLFQLPLGSFGQSQPIQLDSHTKIINDLLVKGDELKLLPGLSMALFADDSIRYFNHGFADINQKISVHETTRFQLGSIGKLITAITILQQVELGNLNLQANISEYIGLPGLASSDFKNNSITLHCLLTHSCGFNDINIGYMARNKQQLQPLEQYVLENNPGLFQMAGTDIVYSNYAYALAGLIVEKVSGESFSRYVDENIFQALGMKNSSLEFPFGYQRDSIYAKGYKKTERGFEEAEIHARHATPAGSLVSTSEDMALFIKTLFNRNSILLSTQSWNQFFKLQFTNHHLLNGYAYGLEQQSINGHLAWAKGGMLPGVLSHLVIVPDKFAMFSVVNTDDDEFGELFYKNIFDKILPDKSEIKSKKDIATNKYTGIYRNKRYHHDSPENIVSLFLGQLNVYDNSTHDTILIYHNGKWHSYFPIDEGLFQNNRLPYEHLVFSKNDKGQIEGLYRNLNIGGLTVPASFERTKWYNSPNFINEYYGFIPLIIFSGLLFIIASFVVRMVRIWKKSFYQTKLLPSGFHILFVSVVILVLLHTYFVPFQLLKETQEFLFGYPYSYRMASVLGYLMIPLAIGLGYLLWKIWKNRLGSIFSRLYLALVEISLIIHIAYLYYWDFL